MASRTEPSDTTAEVVPPRVAETMRRVHAQLAQGRVPSFEALLALGDPGR